MTKEPTESFSLRAIARAFDQIARSDYQLSLAELLADQNKRRARHRFRHVVGVSIKKDFSNSQVVRNSRMENGTDVKWKIDPERLKTTPTTHWALMMLLHSPDRRPNETPKDLALRLHRETLLWRSFQKTIRKYICGDRKLRQKVNQALRGASSVGLVAGVANPKLFAEISQLITATLPTVGGAVAVAAIVIGVLGIEAFCSCKQKSERSSVLRKKKGGLTKVRTRTPRTGLT